MSFPRINLHIHSIFSDGTDTIKQIVKNSLKLGLRYLAITDHFTNSWKAEIIPTLNRTQKINLYLKKITECQNYLKNNKMDLTLYKGVEIDVGSSFDYITRLIEPEKFDIILFEYLETPEGLSFVKKIINHWKKSISFEIPILGLAHFEPANFIYRGLDRLIQFLKKNNIYFEFNSSYSYSYSRKNHVFFEKIKESEIPVGIGCDSHNSRALAVIEEPLEMIKYYHLEDNFRTLIDLLKLK